MKDIVPIGGLCNRLRVIASGLQWAGSEGLRVHWYVSEEMNANYTDVFETPNGVKLVETKGVPLFDRLALSKRIPFFGKNWQITCENWLKVLDFSFVKPTSEMQAIVDSRCAEFPNKVVGVHIRRTDNAESIRLSPSSAFVREMKRAVDDDGIEAFFVASDSDEEKRMLRKEFGDNRIITNEHVASRSDENGLKDAVVDLLMLSRTNKIIGSGWSSFSEVASYIGKIELVRALDVI